MAAKIFYDISVSLSSATHCYPGDPPMQIEQNITAAHGDSARVSRFTCSSHAGTHVDAPKHFNEHGLSIDRIPLAELIGEATVVDLRGLPAIRSEDFARLDLRGVQRLLVKTNNSRLWDLPRFQEQYVAFTRDGARYLREAGIRLVGIDYLSIETFTGDGSVHREFLNNGIIILEGLNLAAVAAGRYELLCLPLAIADGDGAPARVVLRTLPEICEEQDSRA